MTGFPLRDPAGAGTLNVTGDISSRPTYIKHECTIEKCEKGCEKGVIHKSEGVFTSGRGCGKGNCFCRIRN